jgi:hypothetical protein
MKALKNLVALNKTTLFRNVVFILLVLLFFAGSLYLLIHSPA